MERGGQLPTSNRRQFPTAADWLSAAASRPCYSRVIVRGLPEYFTSDVPGKVEQDAASHETWVITDEGAIAGFVVAARKSRGGAAILWRA